MAQSFTVSLGSTTITSTETPGGNWRIEAHTPAPKGKWVRLKTTVNDKYYRRRPVRNHEEAIRWTKTIRGRHHMTRVLGLDVVFAFRTAKARGLVTHEQVRDICSACNAASPARTVHNSREWQDQAIRMLFAITGREEHYMTDAWL